MFNIWVIDDDVEMCEDVIDFWKKLSSGYWLKFRLFSTAQEALEELGSPASQDRSLPKAIIIDGHLKRDEGELVNGSAVILEILDALGGDAPILIAWSADPYANEEMVAAGAKVSFEKTRPREVIRYIQNCYDEAARERIS